jgi:YHS domain-containing protein
MDKGTLLYGTCDADSERGPGLMVTVYRKLIGNHEKEEKQKDEGKTYYLCATRGERDSKKTKSDNMPEQQKAEK